MEVYGGEPNTEDKEKHGDGSRWSLEYSGLRTNTFSVKRLCTSATGNGRAFQSVAPIPRKQRRALHYDRWKHIARKGMDNG